MIGLASDQLEDLVRLAVHDDGHGFDIDIAIVDGGPEYWRVVRLFFELVQLIENSDAVHGANWYKISVHQLDEVRVVDVFKVYQDLGFTLLLLVNCHLWLIFLFNFNIFVFLGKVFL